MLKQGSPHTQGTDFKPWETHGSIKNLLPGKTYVFRIQAETRIGYGPETIWKQKMPILGKRGNATLLFYFVYFLIRHYYMSFSQAAYHEAKHDGHKSMILGGS